MTDLLSIATYATMQSMNTDLLDSFEVHYAIAGDDAWMVSLHNVTYRKASPMNRTATIIAEMRAANAQANADHAEYINGPDFVPTRSGERYPIGTAQGRREASTVATVLLRGTEDILNRNNVRRDFSLPRRAMSMASSRGRVRPDGLASVMAFFQNPAEMATGMLLSFLPTKVSAATAKQVVEEVGLTATPGEIAALIRSINPSTGRNGRAPSRLLIADGVTPPTVDPKRRGRPSGPKYVASLPFGPGAPLQGCEDISGIPFTTAQGEMAGAGFGQGAGWDKVPAAKRTPAQVRRANVAYDASSRGFRRNPDGEIVERW